MDQTKLKKSLDQTVESCVNSVGVNINTASQHLLTYVSGLGAQLAKNIVDFRRENGAFQSRAQLKKVPRLGAVAYQQCAGFLRIPNAKNPLDNSAVHPESYTLVENMAKDCGCTVKELISDKQKRSQLKLEKYITTEVGMPTLNDIMQELDKPGRDPRSEIEEFEFDENIKTVDDLAEGMELNGIVTNITSIISKEKNVMLRSISIDTNAGLFEGNLTVMVNDNKSLDDIIKKVKNVKGVKNVSRT